MYVSLTPSTWLLVSKDIDPEFVMPGRRSTVAPSLNKAQPSKRKAKRSQNALAIAEHQAPTITKIKQSRLGQAEPEPFKRKRPLQDEELDPEEDGGNAKRRRAGGKDRYGNEIELGSDSSGNEWMVGQVDDDDDSEIDSDEAMGESDNEGAAIRGALARPSNKKHSLERGATDPESEGFSDIDLREDDERGDMGDGESDSFGDEAVDLAAMLDESDDDVGLSRAPKGVEDFREAESESGSEDEATDSEAEEEESMLSFSEEDNDAGDPKKLASLQALVSSMTDQDQASERPRASLDAQESSAPSDFGLNSKRKLTVADLVPSITDPKLKKSLKLLADNDTKSSKRGGIPKKLEAPLPKRQQDRLDRAAASEKTKETLKRWVDTVKHNRRAEHLSFPLKDPNAKAAQGSQRLLPTTQTQPLNDLESTIQSILQDSGLAAPNGKSEEDQLQAFEELKTKKMPLEEVETRRAELRRARELLVREEIRAKRIKKIKSKTYRKVHRRERERNAQHEKDALAAAGVDDSESEQERKDRRRAEERMGARHRESKWAKGVKESGRAKWDEDARGGVNEMARRGEELKRRIEGKAIAGNEDEMMSSEFEDDDDDDDGDDLSDTDTRHIAKSNDRLRRLNGDDGELESGTKGSRLASMDFMKNAEAARKARNNAEVESLQRDLAGEETPSEEEDSEGPGRKSYGPAKSVTLPSKSSKLQQKGELEERQPSDNEDDEDQNQPADEELDTDVDVNSAQAKAGSVKKQSINNKQRKRQLLSTSEPVPARNDSAWLTVDKKDSHARRKRIVDSTSDLTISNDSLIGKGAVPIPKSAAKVVPGINRKAKPNGGPSLDKSTAAFQLRGDNAEDDDDEENQDSFPFVVDKEGLAQIQQAFAGDAVAADFQKKNQATIREEDEKKIDNTLPGWGSWTGVGIGKKQERRNKNKVFTKQPGVPKEKRQDAKLDRVIINEKKVKKNNIYRASTLPHPFETRQQYERSLRLPVGPEWATKLAVQDATKPRILMKQGIITPMAKPMI